MKQSKNPQKIGEQETEQTENIIIKGTGLQPHSGLTKSYPTKNKRSVWTSKHGKYVTEENEANIQGIHLQIVEII